jgi:hypothetical protein
MCRGWLGRVLRLRIQSSISNWEFMRRARGVWMSMFWGILTPMFYVLFSTRIKQQSTLFTLPNPLPPSLSCRVTA